MDELVVDNFAGGGGASTGIQMAIGRAPDIAVNHDPEALALYRANHPDTAVMCEDVFSVSPRAVCAGRPVGLAWFSPDCTYFSKARGGKPHRDPRRARKRRGLAGVVLKWAAQVKPRVICVENVEEFQGWGPLLKDGTPCPARRGSHFRRWLRRLMKMGYRVQWQEMRACDFGAPTSRKRLFIVARRDRVPIQWPKPTHGPMGSRPYRTAAECIDWSIPCPSIFARKKPLAEATMRRIARGIQRYVIGSADPFIVALTHQGADRVYSLGEPFRTITGANRGEQALVAAFLAKHYGGPNGVQTPGSHLSKPVGTVTAVDHHAVVASHLVKLKGTCRDGQPLTVPLGTVQAQGNHYAEVRAFLIKYYGVDGDPKITDPLHTVTTKDRHAVVTVTISGVEYAIVDIGMRMLTPRELFRAQGFPESYQIDPVHNGKRLSKTAQVHKCGNSVPPPFSEALVRTLLSS